jgi:hypothetical protein
MVHFPEDAQEELRVLCEKTSQKGARAPGPVKAQPAQFVAVIGVTNPERLVLTGSRVNLGRVEDVLDATGRTVRHNELSFPEDAHDANPSVSRAHAHVALDSASGEWRIFDDGSSLGTTIFRGGERIDIPAHGGRGVALRYGDEIYLGQARLRFEPIPDGLIS